VIREAWKLPVYICALILTYLLVVAASAQPPKVPPASKQEKTVQESDLAIDKEHRLEAEKLADGIEVEIFNEDKWSKVKRIEKPFLFYGDPTRNNDRGSLWGWGDRGRPVATLELFQDPSDRTKWVYAICNTSGGMLRASRGGNPWWRANESASELKDIPEAPVPSTDASQRQRQLKLLAQKFTGYQFWDPNNSRYELRRLERPLHIYRNEDAGLLEGALYALANGTNPEITLFIEARENPKDKTKTKWQFAVGRSAHAELHMDYDGKEVFNAPRGDAVSGSAKPYWLGLIKSDSEPRPEK